LRYAPPLLGAVTRISVSRPRQAAHRRRAIDVAMRAVSRRQSCFARWCPNRGIYGRARGPLLQSNQPGGLSARLRYPFGRHVRFFSLASNCMTHAASVVPRMYLAQAISASSLCCRHRTDLLSVPASNLSGGLSLAADGIESRKASATVAAFIAFSSSKLAAYPAIGSKQIRTGSLPTPLTGGAFAFWRRRGIKRREHSFARLTIRYDGPRFPQEP
jgi:hypothetical protein